MKDGETIVFQVRDLSHGLVSQPFECSVCRARLMKRCGTLESFVLLTVFVFCCEQPDTESGDVVVQLECKQHRVFRREGNNLFMKKPITLLEALTGFQVGSNSRKSCSV